MFLLYLREEEIKAGAPRSRVAALRRDWPPTDLNQLKIVDLLERSKDKNKNNLLCYSNN